MILELLNLSGEVTDSISIRDGIAVPDSEGARFLIESVGTVYLSGRKYMPGDGEDYLRALDTHLNGQGVSGRLRI
jgi:hypothetical protein